MPSPVIWLARHGETEWSAVWRHTSWTDLPLTRKGEKEALALGNALRGRRFELVEASPRLRALRTAELAGFKPEVDDDLVEWDYGELEGLTTAQIQARYPGWNIWDGPWPGGERPDEVADRADRVVRKALALPPGSKTLLFSHGHLLRVLAARWLRQPPTVGRLLALVTGTVSVLGWERDSPVVQHWSVPPDGLLPADHPESRTS
jgi:broad specificity phosphatase PhoE